MINIKRCFKQSRTNSLYNSLKILRFISIFNGLMPLNLSKNGKRVKLRKLCYLSAILHYTLFILCVFLTLEETKQMRALFFKSEATNFVASTYRVTTLALYTTIFIFSLLLRKRLSNIVQIFIDVDEILKELNTKPKYQKITNMTFNVIGLFIIFKIVLNVGSGILFKEAGTPSFAMQVVNNLPYTYLWIYIIIFFSLLFIVQFCFNQINRVR